MAAIPDFALCVMARHYPMVFPYVVVSPAGARLIMKPAGVKVLPLARAPTMKRALTSDLHPILRKPGQSVGPRIHPGCVKFIDKERGLPLAEVFEVERQDVEVTRKSACCSVF